MSEVQSKISLQRRKIIKKRFFIDLAEEVL